MKVLWGLLAALLAMTVEADSRQYGDTNRDALSVSIISLIANPGSFQGQVVRIIGVWRFEKEDQSICLHQEDLDHYLLDNCIWVDPQHSLLKLDKGALMQFNGKYVLVEGTFDKESKGHMGAWSGGLNNVSRIMLWSQKG